MDAMSYLFCNLKIEKRNDKKRENKKYGARGIFFFSEITKKGYLKENLLQLPNEPENTHE